MIRKASCARVSGVLEFGWWKQRFRMELVDPIGRMPG